jgi:hypothetical protein
MRGVNMPSDKTVMAVAGVLILAGLHILSVDSGRGQVAEACENHGEVKIDGKMYVCASKLLVKVPNVNPVCFDSPGRI